MWGPVAASSNSALLENRVSVQRAARQSKVLMKDLSAASSGGGMGSDSFSHQTHKVNPPLAFLFQS